MLPPPSRRVCGTAGLVAAGAASTARALLLLRGGSAMSHLGRPQLPESALHPPTHHVHFGIMQAGTPRPSAPAQGRHVVLGVCSRHITNFSIAPHCENPQQKRDYLSLSSSVL